MTGEFRDHRRADDWIRFGCGLAGVAVAAWLFLANDDMLWADAGLVAGILGGELAGRAIVAARRRIDAD